VEAGAARESASRSLPGESFGLVGESGCGKSTAAYAALRYLPRNGRVSGGSIKVAGEDLLAMGDAAVRRLRATQVSMVYQNPTSALNPTIRIGDQVAEVFTLQGVKDDETRERVEAMLAKVQIPIRRGSWAGTRTSCRAG
jgi:peptide/nickel transport system ATP-binding protein